MNENMSIAIVVVIFGALLGVVLSVVLFLLFRAITCWYFKINKMLDELKKINANLEKIAFMTGQNLNSSQRVAFNSSQAAPAAPAAPAVPTEPATPAARCCVSCGNQMQEGENFCAVCGTKN